MTRPAASAPGAACPHAHRSAPGAQAYLLPAPAPRQRPAKALDALDDLGARCDWAIALAPVFGLSVAVLIQGLSLIGFDGDVWVACVLALIDDY